MKTTIKSGIAIVGLAMTVSLAQAATVAWEFNRPATGSGSGSYPSLATLTLEDGSDAKGSYVRFTLDPNELHKGYSKKSTVDALNIVFKGGSDLSSSAYEYVSGPTANANTFGNKNNPLVAIVPPPNNAQNMDAGYTSAFGQLKLTWDNPDFFAQGQSSVWLIRGTSIADNFSFFAEANNKPSPTFGILSVSDFSKFEGGPTPNPSNWVTGPNPVPLPAAVYLFGSALLGMAGIGYRRNKKQV